LNKPYISDRFYTQNYAKKIWRDQRHKQSLYYIEKFKRLNVFNKGNSLLDVGCGSGELALLLKEEFGIEPSGVEINKVALEQAKKRGLNAKYADLEKKWPYKNNTFNSVIGVEIIEHMVNPDHFLREAKRVLKQEGKLILTTPNLANWFNRILFLLGYQPFFLEASTVDKTVGISFTRKLTENRIPVGHVRVFTLNAIIDLLKLHGFKNIKVIGGKVDCLPPFMSTIDTLFSYVPSLASDMIVVAK
jgi:ubiquinone/menaquinone biosynthesis C-methylase UbiE